MLNTMNQAIYWKWFSTWVDDQMHSADIDVSENCLPPKVENLPFENDEFLNAQQNLDRKGRLWTRL